MMVFLARAKRGFWGCVGFSWLLVSGLSAQADPGPFPRIMFQRPAGISGGAIQHFFSRFDLVAHGGAGPSAYALNESIHALNPGTIILGTSRQGVWPGSFPPECFIYRPNVAELTRAARPGDREIFVTSTAGFPPASEKYRYAMIGGDEWFTYTDLTPTSFTGVSTSGDFYLTRIHPVGDSIKTPIRFVGFGMLQNVTPFAPLVEASRSGSISSTSASIRPSRISATSTGSFMTPIALFSTRMTSPAASISTITASMISRSTA